VSIAVLDAATFLTGLFATWRLLHLAAHKLVVHPMGGVSILLAALQVQEALSRQLEG
jgi:hypothetical protein